MGIQPTSPIVPSAYVSQTGSAYPLNIDGNAIAGLRNWGQFAPRPQQTPNMTLQVDPGAIFNNGILTELGIWTQGTLNSSTSTTVTGSVQGIIVGMSVQGWIYILGTLTPAYPNDTFVTAVAGATITTNNAALISNSGVTLVFGQGVGTICNGNTHSSTTIDNLPNGATANVFPNMLVSGSGVPNGATVSTVAANSVVISNATTTTLTATPITFSVPAPVSNPRIDRVTYSQMTGLLSWTKGTEGATPAVPGIPAGNSPICQLLLATATTAITATSVITDERASAQSVAVAPLRGYIGGLTMSNDGGSPNTVVDVSAGISVSDDNTTLMTSGAFTKTTGSWAVGSGNGALDTGSVAASTWYHLYQIERTDTGLVDFLLSTSASSPNMPSNYTKKRRIGSILTDGSSHIVAFSQNGDHFLWSVSVGDVTLATTSLTAALVTLTVPTGVKVYADFRSELTGASQAMLYTSPDESDQVVATPQGNIDLFSESIAQGGWFERLTNTSAQIRTRSNGSAGQYSIATRGWIDSRGRFS